ncbi:MAG TPA: DUF1684 domain-containing protein [Burkholderiaceae bacterium]|nr:DUF1684 domain-containing protein [Burkholderiaceae bacterium]
MKTLPSLVLLLLAAHASGADTSYEAEIVKWRQEFEADVRTGGWLTLIGHIKLDEHALTIGSDPASNVVLPERAPKQLGTLTRRAEEFQFEPARDADVSIDGKAVSGKSEVSTKSGYGRITTGDIGLRVRSIGDDFYLMVQDSQNPAIRNFKGTTWFPIDPSFRIPARFEAYAHSEKVPLALTHVESKRYFESTGDVTFQLGGKSHRLKSFIEDDRLFIMFQDGTNGKESYGGGRFLYAPVPKDGVTVLDFNKAFNPYCSVNDYVVCPVPLPGSRLGVRVSAGETYAGHE